MFHYGQPTDAGAAPPSTNGGGAQGNSFAPTQPMVLQQAVPAQSSSSSSGALFQFVPYSSSSLPQYQTSYSMPTASNAHPMMPAVFPPQQHTAVFLPPPPPTTMHYTHQAMVVQQQQGIYQNQPRPAPGSPAGSSITHSSHSPVNEPPPCDHNNWDNLRAKHSIVTLCCRDCQQKWKQQFPIRNLCPEFHGRLTCAFGANCPFLHVHRFKSVHKSPDPPGHVAGMPRDRLYAEVAAIVLQENPGKEPHEVVDEVEERVAAAKERKRLEGSAFSGASASVQPSSDDTLGASELSINSFQTQAASVTQHPTPHMYPSAASRRDTQLSDDQSSTENSRSSITDLSHGNAGVYQFMHQAVPQGVSMRQPPPANGGMWSFPVVQQHQLQQQQYVTVQQTSSSQVGGAQQQLVFLQQGGLPQDGRTASGAFPTMPAHQQYYQQHQGQVLPQGLSLPQQPQATLPPGYMYQQQQQAFQAVQLPNGQIVLALMSPGWPPQQGNNAS